jgi:hypothetical protein
MTPDLRNRGNPRNPRMSSRPTIPLKTSIERSPFGPFFTVTFNDFPERAHKAPHSDPKGATESPRAHQGAPKGTKGRTKEGQKEPNGVSMSGMTAQRESKENYINKNFRSTAPAAVMLEMDIKTRKGPPAQTEDLRERESDCRPLHHRA